MNLKHITVAASLALAGSAWASAIHANFSDVAGSAKRDIVEASACRRLQSTDLLTDGKEIEIQHGRAVYRLRLISQGKLILTK